MSTRSKGKTGARKPAAKEVATPTPSKAWNEAYGRGKAFCEMQRPEELADAIQGFKTGILAHLAEVERLNIQAANALNA